MNVHRHFVESYTRPGQPLEGAKVKATDDPDERRLSGSWFDSRITVNVRPVGGRNAGAFRGFVTLSKSDWRAIRAERPAGWLSYTLVVGFTPDDEELWWSALYDDRRLATCAAEEMDGGRWVRIYPEEADRAKVGDVDLFPVMFPEILPVDGPTISIREDVYSRIVDGLRLMRDHESVKHLTAGQIAHIRILWHEAGPKGAEMVETRRRQSGRA